MQIPEHAIEPVTLLGEAERHQVLIEWNETAANYPAQTVHALVEAQARRTPDRRAVESGDQALTYRELAERTDRLAADLQRRGVGPGMLVGIFLERSVEMLVAVLAVLRAGGAYVPLDPAFPKDRLAFMVDDAAARVILAQRGLEAELPPHRAQVVYVDEPLATEATCPASLSGPGDLAYVLYTSGSTGKPNGVQISHRSLVNFLWSMRDRPGFSQDDVMLAVTTLSFDIAGLELFLPLICGGKVVVATRQMAADGELLAREFAARRITVMQGTPTTWRLLLSAGWEGSPGVKILCGGEAFPPDLARQLVPRCGELWNLYGPTETTIWSTSCRIVDPEAPIHIGRPINNTATYILDSNMRPVAIGTPGELFIGGDGVALGYLNRPELTAERFVPDPFGDKAGGRLYRTGDLARYLPGGEIQYLGRLNHQVKIRGFRIALGEIEAVLSLHPEVRESVIVAFEIAPNDQRLAAYFAVAGGAERASELLPQIQALLRSKLPQYMLPSIFVLLERLPKTPSGKIDRRALPPSDQPSVAASAHFEPPADPVEQRLAAIWEESLHVRSIGRHDSFFDLGGNSLLAVAVFSEIDKQFQQHLPMATLLTSPTIATFAEVLRNTPEAPQREWSSLVPLQPRGTRPPFWCVHGGDGNVLLYRDLARQFGEDHPFYGLQSQGLDGRAPLLDTVEEMAATYLGEIRARQPEGPYFIGGYCMGGTVAYEIAQLLRRAGHEVALLALLDTYNFHRREAPTLLRYLRQKVRFHFTNLVELPLRNWPGYLSKKFNAARDQEVFSLRSVSRTRSVKEVNDHAAETYRPKPYEGRVTLFKPRVNYDYYPDPEMGWGDLATGGLEIIELPVNPHAMLVEPYTRLLADRLKNAVDERSRPRPGGGVGPFSSGPHFLHATAA